MIEATITELQEALRARKVSARELAKESLDSMERQEGNLHAFLARTPELAFESAERADQMLAQGNAPPLCGIPCAIKDAILVEGVLCTAGSLMLENYTAPYDATVVRLLREQGAVMVGKTNTDEFGMGASTENSAFGATRNPRDPERVPGGSSGGSAAAVAAAECVFALGEDTGGSIRLPAGFCGVVGLRPTYGTVSRHGVISLASSFDQVGPFARTCRDAEIVYEAIAHKDPKEATSAERPASKKSFGLKGLRIGAPKEYFTEGLSSVVEQGIRSALGKLEGAGAVIVEVELPNVKYGLAAYYVINTSEASANLARYDGLRYGLHTPASTIKEMYEQNRSSGFGDEVKRRIILGTFALSAGYYEAYYLKAQKVRTLLRQDFERAFASVDVIAGPVSPVLPFKLGERSSDPLAMYLVDIYTVPVNLAGLPGLTIPAAEADGLPIGMQLVGPQFSEPLLFGVGKAFESL
ncbi:MAG: Asp-tRNA(Asn)/Glu-tRNA(Gln) amidotransferase subunit GatA [bacterium]|nr:Asp-tRNA(Asn)/Glu-tRNA(Gln) amidotransferase subunit GatA [bacterium]MDZ4231741.1 Asp-tRNA(Asn)/Glu-tRNA(Gln) amidotransferase subunit GatA [Candidatus Pacearchaeota archaeon]